MEGGASRVDYNQLQNSTLVSVDAVDPSELPEKVNCSAFLVADNEIANNVKSILSTASALNNTVVPVVQLTDMTQVQPMGTWLTF